MRRYKKANPHFFCTQSFESTSLKNRNCVAFLDFLQESALVYALANLIETKRKIGLHEKKHLKSLRTIFFWKHWLRRTYNCVNISEIFSISIFLLYEFGRLQNAKFDFQSFKKDSTDPVDIAVCMNILYL